MANRLTRRIRPLIALVALTGSALIAPSLASAAPRTSPHSDPSVTSVQQKLGDLAMQNSQIVEKYDQARLAVATREKAAAGATRAARTADRTYAARRAQFVQMIQAQYEGSSYGATAALLDSDSNSNYLDRLATLNIISSNTAQVVTDVRRAQSTAATASSKADHLLAQARSTKAALGKKKADVAAQIDKYRTLLGTLSAKQRQAYTTADRAPAADTTPKNLQHLTAAGTGAARAAVKFALAQVGKPYVFGAAGPGSYDCSGLTMAAWHHGGVSLPHSAAGQYSYGHHVNRADLEPGDLIFFYQPIGHVTIYIGDGLMVSAPTEGEPVQVVPLSHFNGDYTGATRLT